jgi:hypothetical protein
VLEAGSSRPGALAGVVLLRSGHVVAELPLRTSSMQGKIATYDYEPGVAEPWTLLVLDRDGNRYESAAVMVTCASGYERAPLPFISVSDSYFAAGDPITLDPRVSSDPDGSYSRLAAQWDLDGDGEFDTPLSTSKYLETRFTTPGIHRVQARLVDEQGHASVSLPIGVRVRGGARKAHIDVKPGDPRNAINPFAKGGVWVAILSDYTLDALQVDVSSVRLGPGHAAAVRHDVRDVNGDGSPDLLLRFGIAAIGIACGDQHVKLRGETFAGERVVGSDSIATVGCAKN